MRRIIVFLDRDGTLTHDDDFYLGSQKNWKQCIKFLPGVKEWLQKITQWNREQNIQIFTVIVTNQSWCAFCSTEKHHISLTMLEEVNEYIEKEIAKYGGKIDLTLYSPYISEDAAKKYHNRGICIRADCIKNSSLTKPNIGMMKQTLEFFGVSAKECMFFMIGDRGSDMDFGKRIGARKNYLIPSKKTEIALIGDSYEYFQQTDHFGLAIDDILHIISQECF